MVCMDNKYFIWLRTEYKRAALMLPMILRKAVILAAVCGITAFCAGAIDTDKDAEPKLRIGYVAEDNMLTRMAVSFVQDMESFKSLCSLEPVTEQEGKTLLEEGRLSALIVLPKDVMNEILSGSNAPAMLYLPDNGGHALTDGGLDTVRNMLFEELVSAGTGMLGTAQAEIYASYSVLQKLGAADADTLQAIYDDINRFNLAAVAEREELFLTKRLSITGNDTYAVYFGSAFLTIYVLFAGLFVGDYCKRGDFWQRMADRRIGVGYVAQLLSSCLAGSFLVLGVVLFPLLAYALLGYAMPRAGAALSLRVTPAGAGALVVITVFATVYHMMLCQVMERRESAVVVIGIPALLQAYLSGCLIPSVLLPEAVTAVGKLTPAFFIKKGFTAVLAGGDKGLLETVSGLAVWGMILFGATIVLMRAGACREASGNTRSGNIAGRIHVPFVGTVLFRRLLHKKSIWISMALFAALSAGIVHAEKNSETRIHAAVYDASGKYGALLENYDGLVSFELCDDREQVMDAVLRGTAECGYVLPKELAGEMMSRRAARSVTVYQDEDAVAVPVVNEILFERIFRGVSLEWYGNYISELGTDQEALRNLAQEYFDRELSEDATFRVMTERIGGQPGGDSQDSPHAEKGTYPVYAAGAVVIALCALQGAVQVFSDIRNRRFYKRSRLMMAVLTMALPVLFGIFMLAAVVMVTDL